MMRFSRMIELRDPAVDLHTPAARGTNVNLLWVASWQNEANRAETRVENLSVRGILGERLPPPSASINSDSRFAVPITMGGGIVAIGAPRLRPLDLAQICAPKVNIPQRKCRSRECLQRSRLAAMVAC